MPNNAPTAMGVGKRITILDTIGEQGNHSDGQSLRGQNVQNFPEAALFFVRNSNRLYKLKKHLAVAIAEDVSGNDNVINGIGSSAERGRFVAVLQMAIVTLAADEGGSTGTIGGFDVNPGGFFHCTYDTFAGAVGSLRAEIASDTQVTVVSSSTTDTSQVFVTYYEASQSE